MEVNIYIMLIIRAGKGTFVGVKLALDGMIKKTGGQVGKQKKTIAAASLVDKRGCSGAGCRPGGYFPAAG